MNLSGRKFLIKEALAPLERKYTEQASLRKMRALKDFQNRTLVDHMPLRAELEHPIIATRYWWNERKVTRNVKSLNSLTPFSASQITNSILRIEALNESYLNQTKFMANILSSPIISFGAMFTVFAAIFERAAFWGAASFALVGLISRELIVNKAHRRLLEASQERLREIMIAREEGSPIAD